MTLTDRGKSSKNHFTAMKIFQFTFVFFFIFFQIHGDLCLLVRWMAEVFSNRRGFGSDANNEALSASGHGQAEHGPIIMKGPARRQGDGWKGMKPWNERSVAA